MAHELDPALSNSLPAGASDYAPPPRVPVVWSFDGFRLDLGRRELCRDLRSVALEPKPRELLILLLECYPNAASTTQIVERLWPDVVVTPASVHRAVNALRAALRRASGNSAIVRTVRGFGYGLDAVVERKLPTGDLSRP